MASIYVTLVLYMCVLFGLGIWCSRRNKNVTDFMLAGRGLTLIPATLALTATLFGGGCLTGTAQMGYDDGYIGVVYGVLSGLVFAFLIFMVRKMENFSKYATITEFLEDRFHSKTLRAASSVLSMIALLGILGSQVSSITGFLRAMGLQHVVLAAFGAMVVIIALTAMGGLLAVTTTDCFQIIIVIIGVCWTFFLAWGNYGGASGIAAALDSMADVLPATYRGVPITSQGQARDFNLLLRRGRCSGTMSSTTLSGGQSARCPPALQPGIFSLLRSVSLRPGGAPVPDLRRTDRHPRPGPVSLHRRGAVSDQLLP